ncbi:MAG TPA: hypothetical protein VGO95_06800 [Modestobacter sp.]|nr:hypothetical protein [Modestobacter sp.]
MPLHWLPPLLGPAVLAPLAAELVRRGHVAGVPDLRPRVTEAPGWRQRWVAAAAASGPADAVLGFSGAGVTLPAVAAAVGARRLARVDALLPVRSGATVPDDDIRDRVAALVSDVRIADWPVAGGPDGSHLDVATGPRRSPTCSAERGGHLAASRDPR